MIIPIETLTPGQAFLVGVLVGLVTAVIVRALDMRRP